MPQEDRTMHADADDAGSFPADTPRDDREESVKCPRCGYSFITKTSGKQKLRTRVLVFVENGNVMGICPKCKANLKVPVSFRGGTTEGNAAGSPKRPKDSSVGPHDTEGGTR